MDKKQTKILILDDDSNILELLEFNLQFNYDVIVAQSGQEALVKIKESLLVFFLGRHFSHFFFSLYFRPMILDRGSPTTKELKKLYS